MDNVEWNGSTWSQGWTQHGLIIAVGKEEFRSSDGNANFVKVSSEAKDMKGLVALGIGLLIGSEFSKDTYKSNQKTHTKIYSPK